MQASGFAGNTSRKGREHGVRGPVELASERVGRDLTSVTGARSAPGGNHAHESWVGGRRLEQARRGIPGRPKFPRRWGLVGSESTSFWEPSRAAAVD